jgi:hypothetical protein
MKLDQGTYYMNATDANNYKAQATFTIGPKHIVATPRKTSFSIGDTISFTIEHSFGKTTPVFDSVIKIYSPDGTLYFSGDPLETWTKTGDWYTAPYSSQTAGGNEMTLASDAPVGTWTWKWIDSSTDAKTILSGTLTVVASAGSNTDAKITALGAQITSVASSVSSLATTVGNIATTANAASQAATASSQAATAASQAATAASQAATAAGSKADAATAAANSAKTSADSAAAAANGLTTLVYAAIGASLVAALAAIVALMQISRKIA